MNAENFLINFNDGRIKMRVGLFSTTEEYENKLKELKESCLLIKQYDHFCTFLSEGQRYTIFDGEYLERNKEEILGDVVNTWGQESSVIFEILLSMINSMHN